MSKKAASLNADLRFDGLNRASFSTSAFHPDDLELDDKLDLDANADASTERPFAEVGALARGLHKRSSTRTLDLDDGDQDNPKSADDLAAEVACKVKNQFREDLPKALLEEYAKRDCLAPFNPKEIVLGRKLGSGEFSHVYLIKSFALNTEDEPSNEEECNARKHLKLNERNDSGKECYAIKHLRPEFLDKYDALDYAQAAR